MKLRLPILFMLIPGSLLAQRDSTRVDSTRAFPLRPLVVSVARTPIAAERSGFSVTVLTHEQLAVTRPLHAIDALRNVAGAQVDEAVGAGGPAIIRLRGGEEVFTQILIDGVQVNENGGFFDFQGLHITGLDRIEIARGPQSAMWGSSAMTGVVNFITQPGQAGPARFNLQLERGVSDVRSNSYAGNGGVSGGWEKFRYSAHAGRTFMRGIHAVPHDVKTDEGAVRFDASPARSVEVMALVRGVNVDANAPVRDPGATRVPLDPNARNERDRVIGLLQVGHDIASWWHQQLKLSGLRQNFLYSDQSDGLDPNSLPVFVFDASFAFDARLRRSTAEYSWNFAPTSQSWLRAATGVQWEREKLTEDISGDFQDHASRERDSRAGFAELRANPVEPLDLLFSTRVEKYDGLRAEYTPRFSVAYALTPVLRLRAAAARGYKAPNLREQYLDNPFIASNPDLRAESSTSWEVGADVGSSRASLSASFFRQSFRNLIRTVALEGTQKQINRNLGRSSGTGFEWEGRLRLTNQLLASSSGAVVKTEIKDNRGLSPDQYPVGEELPFRPDYTGSAALQWQPTAKFRTLMRGTMVGEQTVLTERFSGARRAIDKYGLLGANLSYAYKPQSEIYLRVDNLLNREYATAFDQRGMPRTVSLGVALEFGAGNR
jgi:vitamin B12 transporter